MSKLIDAASAYVTGLLTEDLPTNCLYHNITHTKRVFKSTKEIVEHIELSPEDSEIVFLATLFHDTGYCADRENHEERSVEIATKFLQEANVDTAVIEKVKACILATKMEAIPETLLEKIIRDADASHFGKDYFQEASEFLRLELQLQNIKNYSKQEWMKENISMLQNVHSYYTDYAKENWEPIKQKNIQAMIEAQNQAKKIKASKKEKEALAKAKAKKDDPEKAIQSVFRVTLKNHIKLSDIADTKANILLSVNAIIISIALSNLIPKLDNPSNQYLIWPTIVFIIFTVITIVLSVLATRPNVTSGKFTKQDVDEKKVNLLFFGNFHKMSLQEFEWAMNEMLGDKDYMYSSLTKDLYFLGLVLNRKYKLLRITYNIFVVGIVISVASFAISLLITETAH